VTVYPDETVLAHAVNELARSSARVVLDFAEWRERALAAEARVRDLEETVGELLEHIEPVTCPACGAFYAWCW
jgi:hypothetical protein